LLSRTSGYNRLLRSQEFDNATWAKTGTASVTPNTDTAPDGTLTADTLNFPATAEPIAQAMSGIGAVGETWVFSIWLWGTAGQTIAIVFDSQGGTLESVSEVVTLTGAATRYDITMAIVNSGHTSLTAFIVRNPGQTATAVKAWGAQFEPGAVPGSYAGTTTAAVTPATDPLFTFLGYTQNVVWGLQANAPNQHQNGWYAERPVVNDTGDLPVYERALARALGGQTYGLDFATRYDRMIGLAMLADYKTWKADEGAAHVNEAIERLFDAGWQRLRWWPDASVEGTYEDLVLDPETVKRMQRNRLSPAKPLYALNLGFWKFIP
jgi:hypothetical protein